MCSITSWVSFKLEDLFEAIVGDVDLQKKDFTEQGIPVISAGTTNNGVVGYTEKEARIVPENTITVDMFGNVRYRDFKYKLATHGRVFALKSKTDLTENAGLFLEEILSKHLVNFSYSRMCNWNKIKDIEIKLPSVESEEPAWKYMDDYIKELEQDYIKELEQYLKATGLEDCTLTNEDVEILNKKIETKNIKLVELFEKRNTKNIKGKVNDYPKERSKAYNLPLVSATAQNQGISRYAKEECANNILNNLITISANGSCGATFYHSDQFGIIQDVYAIHLKDGRPFTQEIGLYLTSCLEKLLIGNYNWSYKPGWERVKNETITIPITKEGKPDYDYMQTYIKALEKVVIKDVVEYKNDFINKTKEIVNKEEKEGI